jgi:outer membrane protein assembly factor BamB
VRLWVAPAPDSNAWVGTPIVLGRAVIFAVGEGLAAFDTASGAPLWRAALTTPDRHTYPANIVTRGTVACVIDSPASGCVDGATGRVVWKTPTDTTIESGVASADDNALYYGTRNHRVVAIRLADGSARWSADVAPDAPFQTFVRGTAVRGDTVYAATRRYLVSNGFKSAGDLVALDARTGKILWKYAPPGDSTQFQTAPVLAGNVAVLTDVLSHGLRAVDLTTHEELWRTPMDASGYVDAQTTPIVLADTVFAASTDQQLYALDLQTGRRLWRVQAADGSLYQVAPCGNQLVVTLYAGGDPHAVNRSTKRQERGRFLDGDFVRSVGTAGNMAFLVGSGAFYGVRCGGQ